MNIIIIALITLSAAMIFAWIFSLDIKTTATLLIILLFIIFIITYFTVPEFAIKMRIVNETNKYQTQQDITTILSADEIKYYKTAMLFKPNECINHTVNYIIKIGKDLSKSNIRNYFN